MTDKKHDDVILPGLLVEFDTWWAAMYLDRSDSLRNREHNVGMVVRIDPEVDLCQLLVGNELLWVSNIHVSILPRTKRASL